MVLDLKRFKPGKALEPGARLSSFFVRAAVLAEHQRTNAHTCASPVTLSGARTSSLPDRIQPLHTHPYHTGLLWVVEQIPGRLQSEDLTRLLEFGYFSS